MSGGPNEQLTAALDGGTIRITRQSSGAYWCIEPDDAPAVIEWLIENGRVDAAKDAALAWLALLARRHGITGLEIQDAAGGEEDAGDEPRRSRLPVTMRAHD